MDAHWGVFLLLTSFLRPPPALGSTLPGQFPVIIECDGTKWPARTCLAGFNSAEVHLSFCMVVGSGARARAFNGTTKEQT